MEEARIEHSCPGGTFIVVVLKNLFPAVTAVLINLILLLVSMALFLFCSSDWKPVGGKNYFFLPGVYDPLGISKSAGFYAVLSCAKEEKYISETAFALKSQYMLKHLSNSRSSVSNRESLLCKTGSCSA